MATICLRASVNSFDVDGARALKEFTDARKQIVETLRKTETAMWQRKARHAIFGPTDFSEVMSFAADHDRSHTQQFWKTVKNVQVERV